jgi:hypothetical protein
MPLILTALFFVFVPWLIYKIVHHKHKEADNAAVNSQRHMKRWIPKLAPTNRQKQLTALIVAVGWVLTVILWLTWRRGWYGWTDTRVLTLAIYSMPAALFAGIAFWWYSGK